MHSLSPRALHTARLTAEALFCGPQGPPPSERLDWLSRELADLVSRAGLRALLLTRLCLLLVSVLVPLYARRLQSLSAVPLAERVNALSRIERGPFATVVVAIKAMLCVLYYEHTDAARNIGFVGAGVS